MKKYLEARSQEEIEQLLSEDYSLPFDLTLRRLARGLFNELCLRRETEVETISLDVISGRYAIWLSDLIEIIETSGREKSRLDYIKRHMLAFTDAVQFFLHNDVKSALNEEDSLASTEFQWSKLSALQVGRYAEYMSMLEFTKQGAQVFSSEVDDRGIDFVIRTENGNYFDIQVKSLRRSSTSYVFFRKDKFVLRPNLWSTIIVFSDGHPPAHYLIPSEAWLSPNSLFKSRDYEGKKSAPEWGLDLSKRNEEFLNRYRFNRQIRNLLSQG